MTFSDSELFILLIRLFKNHLPYPMIKNYQPSQQGTPTEAFLTIHKIDSKRYGYFGNHHVYNETDQDFDSTYSQWTEAMFQIGGKSIKKPGETGVPTTSDIVQMASDVLQMPETRQTLLKSKIGILRIQNLRHLYFVDDRDRHEQDVTFDFTLSYNRKIMSKTPIVNRAEADTNRV